DSLNQLGADLGNCSLTKWARLSRRSQLYQRDVTLLTEAIFQILNQIFGNDRAGDYLREGIPYDLTDYSSDRVTLKKASCGVGVQGSGGVQQKSIKVFDNLRRCKILRDVVVCCYWIKPLGH